MNWKGLGNLVLSGLAVAATAFIGSLQVAGTDPRQAGINAGIAVAAALINHLRQAPVLTVPPAAPLVLALLAFGLGGCSGMQPSGTTTDQAILAAGDIGAIGCVALVTEADPGDIARARIATAAAQNVLASSTPTLTALQTALLAADLPPQYRALAAVFLQRVSIRVGSVDPLPKGSPGFQMAEAFVTACAAALGTAV